MSLIEPIKKNGGLYIDTVFDKNQSWIWTSDLYSALSAWVVSFDVGSCGSNVFSNDISVRAVR